jgi:hypothetical protein
VWLWVVEIQQGGWSIFLQVPTIHPERMVVHGARLSFQIFLERADVPEEVAGVENVARMRSCGAGQKAMRLAGRANWRSTQVRSGSRVNGDTATVVEQRQMI